MNTIISAEDEKFYLINHIRNQVLIADIFKLLRAHGVEPITIKGWAVARYYPLFSRLYADIDICVHPENYQKALQILDQKSFNIDLHCGVRHLDSLEWDEIFDNSILIHTEHCDIRVPREEDHLRIICIHWLNDGGIDKERLKDIFYLVKNRSKDFDWDRFLGVVTERRRQWLECAIGIADIYLDLSDFLKDTPLAHCSNKVPPWIIKNIEKSWKENIKIIPIDLCFREPKEFFKQLKLRIPPNPIESIIEQDGDIMAGRIKVSYYQTLSFFRRLYNFLWKITKSKIVYLFNTPNHKYAI